LFFSGKVILHFLDTPDSAFAARHEVLRVRKIDGVTFMGNEEIPIDITEVVNKHKISAKCRCSKQYLESPKRIYNGDHVNPINRRLLHSRNT